MILDENGKVIVNEKTINNTEFIAQSNKYLPIKTAEVISEFTKLGFSIEDYQEANFRNLNKENKVRHMVRMSADNDMGIRRDIVIFNSHDSSTSLRLNMGAYRGVCMNTMVFGDNLLPEERIKHTAKNAMDRVLEYAHLVLDKLDEEKQLRYKMEAQRISPLDLQLIAKEVIKIREKEYELVLDPAELTLIRRREDRDNNLFIVYNRLQEALLKGHYQKLGYMTDKDTGEKHEVFKKAKELTNPNEIIRVNKELHDLCSKLVL